MSGNLKIIQVICFCVVNMIVWTWLWHLSLGQSDHPTPVRHHRNIMKTILKSFMPSALDPFKNEMKSFSRYNMPSIRHPADRLLSYSVEQDDFDILSLNLHEKYFAEYISTYAGVYIDDNGRDIIAVTPHNERANQIGRCVLTNSSWMRSYGVALGEYNIKSYSDIVMRINKQNSNFSAADCSRVQSRLEQEAKTLADTLVVFTTCNQLRMTVRALSSLQSCQDQFDLLVVDDFSIDGTVDYLMKKVPARSLRCVYVSKNRCQCIYCCVCVICVLVCL